MLFLDIQKFVSSSACANLTLHANDGDNVFLKSMTFTFTFIRRFYPKRLTLHSSYSFYILSALAFPGNRTHDLGVASAMLYQLSYRKAVAFLRCNVFERNTDITFVINDRKNGFSYKCVS